MSQKKTAELELAGRKLILETGELAERAQASVLARYGDTIALSTVCIKEKSEEVDFLPLTVDYEEKLYAGGKISTSRFIKREGRPSEEAILSARLIDRTIRPLFDPKLNVEIQVVVTVLSVDLENDPAILAIIATSAAIVLSGLPWAGPVGVVRVGLKDGSYLLNPTEAELDSSDLDLAISATSDGIVMLEATTNQISEEVFLAAAEFGQKQIADIVNLISKFAAAAGKKKLDIETTKVDLKLEAQVRDFIAGKLLSGKPDKNFGTEAWYLAAKEKIEADFGEKLPLQLAAAILDESVDNYLRRYVLRTSRRLDGRGFDEIRPIEIETGLLPRTHGSAMFKRGDTQVLSVVTLGSPALEQLIDGMTGEKTKRFMHHYNFPPFSTGEVKRIGSPGRREIGHGVLTERALLPVIPAEEKFPYTVRVVSEVLASAGSTSMAAVCGSTLALQDAGVNISDPVAGVAIGLISQDGKEVLLADIAYAEDSSGDMDFKIAGTKTGLTALQMDLKIHGISLSLVRQALEQARKARMAILEKMAEVLPATRPSLSPYAPRVSMVKIDPSKIGEVIGSGGKVIRNIMAQTGTAIDVEDDGTISVSGKDSASCGEAVERIKALTREVVAGETFEGTVKRILPFGAMVEFLPGKEGMVHISKLAPYRVGKVEDVVRIGQKVKVRVSETDSVGRVNLSMKLDDSGPARAKKRQPQSGFLPHRRF